MKFLRMTLFLSCCLCLTAGVLAAEDAKSNILIILADDWGRADFSAFGTSDIRTPHLDRVFREGMTFENFRANSCVCSPTRAALLTGCYPDRVGVPGVIREEEPQNSWGYLSRSAVMLPSLLKQANYHSAIVGKWHLGLTAPNRPNDRGFDLFHGFLGDMMDDYWSHLRHGQNFMRLNNDVIEPQGHATDLFTQWACDYLIERRRHVQPFFLYLAYNAPHDPIQPPQEWLDKVLAREPKLDPKRAKLVALIEHFDEGVGRVLKTLDDNGQSQNTLVILTSDNGGLLTAGAKNGPWRSGKTHLYEGGLRVPFAARWPNRIKAGSKTDVAGMSMDLFSTALHAAGIELPSRLDGTSLLPTLLGQLQSELVRDHYFVRREGGIAYGGKTIEAFQRGSWKLIQDSPYAPLELYNLANDPFETTDVAAKEKRIVNELNAALRLQIQRAGSVPWQPLP